MEPSRPQLEGSWVHSHEEDTAEGMVFRKNPVNLPPSRGRIGFELRQDGSAQVMGIAATDGSTYDEAKWLLDGHQLQIKQGKANQEWKILDIEEDKMVLAPPTP